MCNSLVSQESFKDKEKEEIRQIIEEYIMENPEVILNSVAKMRSREKEEEKLIAKKNLIELKDEIMWNPTDPVGGNIMGDVTVVEFFVVWCSAEQLPIVTPCQSMYLSSKSTILSITWMNPSVLFCMVAKFQPLATSVYAFCNPHAVPWRNSSWLGLRYSFTQADSLEPGMPCGLG